MNPQVCLSLKGHFLLPQQYASDPLSHLLTNAMYCLCPQQPFHALLLLWNQGCHLLFDLLHLFVELSQPAYKVAVSMDFSRKAYILNLG